MQQKSDCNNAKMQLQQNVQQSTIKSTDKDGYISVYEILSPGAVYEKKPKCLKQVHRELNMD